MKEVQSTIPIAIGNKVQSKIRPFALSIAGFDPSGGAGILADIKTFEQLKTYGLGVITANTIQTEHEFDSVNWVNQELLYKQAKVILEKYPISHVKIGIIESLDVLAKLIHLIQFVQPQAKIIWDPVIKSSTEFNFGNISPSGGGRGRNQLEEILKELYLITPNLNEIKMLSQEEDVQKGALFLSKYCHVYLKGGHSEDQKGKDFLYTKEGKIYPYRAKKIITTPKHGSGCVLSSAITAYLALGYPLVKAGLYAKEYTLKVLDSNEGLLGYHK